MSGEWGEYKGKTVCWLCHAERREDGIDPCLGKLPGVAQACCGHGKASGYVIFENGVSLRFDLRTAIRMSGPDSFSQEAGDAYGASGGKLDVVRLAPDAPQYATRAQPRRKRA